jgi:hypothetical protein
MRVFTALLTWRKHLDIWNCWYNEDHLLDQKYGCNDLISSLNCKGGLDIDVNICEAACLWLYKILAVDAKITGLFFDDGNIYTDLTLLYAQAQHINALSYM